MTEDLTKTAVTTLPTSVMTERMRFASMQQRSAIRRAISLPCTLVRTRDLKTVGRIGLDLYTQKHVGGLESGD